jgi:hypothetical protein
MVAEHVAAGGVGTVEASEGDLVEAIMPHRPLQQFKTRTSSQLSVGSEKSHAIVSLSLSTLNFVATICFSSTSIKTNNCVCVWIIHPCSQLVFVNPELFVTCQSFVGCFESLTISYMS